MVVGGKTSGMNMGIGGTGMNVGNGMGVVNSKDANRKNSRIN